jgi:hypothetical protein
MCPQYHKKCANKIEREKDLLNNTGWGKKIKKSN